MTASQSRIDVPTLQCETTNTIIELTERKSSLNTYYIVVIYCLVFTLITTHYSIEMEIINFFKSLDARAIWFMVIGTSTGTVADVIFDALYRRCPGCRRWHALKTQVTHTQVNGTNPISLRRNVNIATTVCGEIQIGVINKCEMPSQ